MKFKLLRRRLSISAPRMTIKTHIPWPLRALAAIVVLGISVALGLWAYDLGKRFAGLGPDLKAEVERLREQVETLTTERDRLAANSNTTGDSRLNLERSMQEQLASQIKSLEMENGKLKDDLAFFENLSGGAAAPTGVSIKRFEVEPSSVRGQMRYRILLVQGGRSNKDFAGNFQLVLTLQQGGKAVMMTLPKLASVGSGLESEADPNSYLVSFRFYKRIEGTFSIPADATLKQVQARILEHGAMQAQQMIVMK